MKLPRFSRWITIPVLFMINFLAWLYVYDEYMMSWIIVYPLFMLVAAGFTIAAELAFGRDRKVKYIGINICLVLLLLVLAQKYLPMDKLESNLLDNYYGHIKADAPLNSPDKAVRIDGYTIVARDYDTYFGSKSNMAGVLEVYKNGESLNQITITDAVKKIQELVPVSKQGEFQNLLYNDARYVGVKRKGGVMSLIFIKGYVEFKYNLAADGSGFIWDKERYKIGGLSFPKMEGLYGDETNRRIKDILLKGDKEQPVDIEIVVKGDKTASIKALQGSGYEIVSEEPLIVRLPFYEFANLGHQNFIETLEIK